MEMPIEIPRLFINLFRKPGEPQLVFDPFAGTGIVAKASQMLGLRSVSFELENIQYNKLVLNHWPYLHEIPQDGGSNAN